MMSAAKDELNEIELLAMKMKEELAQTS